MPALKHKTVASFLESLSDDQKSQVLLLREIITSIHADLIEHIKWNSPSYMLNGEDRITFNVVNKEQAVQLIIHMGTTRKENKAGTPILSNDGGIVRWSSDIRGVISFTGLGDVTARRSVLEQVLSQWLAIEV